ncbi:MAG: hypothetical protein JWR85_3869 [Marmoricola sp.]|nr:hypothetical protein [Marmoricola sp.]
MWDFLPLVDLDSFRRPWMHTHAQLPTPLVLDQNTVRVYFASRDERQYSSIGYVDLEYRSGSGQFAMVRVSEDPVLSPGPIGHFDEHGVYPSCVIRHEGQLLMYFIGWNKGVEPPLFYASIGVATSSDGATFSRISPAPLLSRSPVDPCLVTSPHVLEDEGVFRMTYVSGIRWERNAAGVLQSYYHIQSATGTDPFNWKRDGKVAIGLAPGESNIARSSVLKLAPGSYAMWFSYVHSTIGRYRIGFAQSADGENWHRSDHLGGMESLPDFASEMMCYPSVFEMGGNRFMLVNGNNFGMRGFGIARWRDGQH